MLDVFFKIILGHIENSQYLDKSKKLLNNLRGYFTQLKLRLANGNFMVKTFKNITSAFQCFNFFSHWVEQVDHYKYAFFTFSILFTISLMRILSLLKPVSKF